MLTHSKIIDSFQEIESALKNAFETDPDSGQKAIDIIKNIVFGNDDIKIVKSIFLLKFYFAKAFHINPNDLTNPKSKSVQILLIKQLFVFNCRLIFGYRYSNKSIGELISINDATTVSNYYNECYKLLFSDQNQIAIEYNAIWRRYLDQKIELARINGNF